MRTNRYNPVIFVLIMGLTIMSCSTKQAVASTKTAPARISATATMQSTRKITKNTPLPSKTHLPTIIPLAAKLTDGSDSWPISTITLDDSASIDGSDVSAEDGTAYLKIVFNNPKHKLLPFPTITNSTDVDYSRVYISNGLGEEYSLVSDHFDLLTGADGSSSYGDLTLVFEAMPVESDNFQLFFADLAPIDLGNLGTPAPAANPPIAETVSPTAAQPLNVYSFSDDFSSNANKWLTGDKTTDEGSVNREFSNGKYIISMTSKQDFFYVVTPIPVYRGSNFTLSIDATVLDSTVALGNMTLELSTRQMDGLSGRQYNFILMDDGSSSLDLWPDDNSQDVVSLWSQDANSLIQLDKGVTRTISLVMDGPKISAFVNGQKIDSVADSTVTGAGSISLGICLYNAGDNLTIALDNLRIQDMP